MSMTTIVLVMHGAPPSDFPRDELAELFGLHMRLEHQPQSEAQQARLEARHAELDIKMRNWPRTPQNDPFFAASVELTQNLAEAVGTPVLVGFNEFCAPTLDEALDEAATSGARRVVVATPMMTRGGEHSERDIPAAIERARKRHPTVAFDYVWPFDAMEVARFLAGRIAAHLGAGA
jgi:sirohydrochlorin cobaltochelatase